MATWVGILVLDVLLGYQKLLHFSYCTHTVVLAEWCVTGIGLLFEF